MPIEVAALQIYPIKSCRPTTVDNWAVEQRGFRHDRRWMIIDKDGRFRTRREMPILARIEPHIQRDTLTLKKEGLKEISVPLIPEGPEIDVQIWNATPKATAVSREADAWVSEAVGEESRLVYMSETSRRDLAASYNSGNDIVSFADAFPILVLSYESVDDLNSRLDSPITFHRFRPNLLLKGCKPYEEDSWKRIQIGDVVLRAARTDIRCLVTTQDPLTGEVLGQEPLRTLATYRRVENGVIFGMYYVPEKLGEISVGMTCAPLS